MVIDTSAIIAILANEPEAEVFADTIAATAVCLMSAASMLESSMVFESRYGIKGGNKLD